MRTMGKSCKMIGSVVEFGCVCFFLGILDMKLVVEDNATLMKMMEGFASGPKGWTIRMQG
jgi:hypothetical protein